MSNLKPDKKNANKGTERGRELLQNSLAKYGAGRSILVDKHGNIIAGNKTFEQASAMGLKVRTIETSGDELVVVQRNDLDLYEGTTARELAYADNRVAEVDLAWESEQVAADFASGIDLNALGFSEKDLKDILGDLYPEEKKDAEPQFDRAAELLKKWQVQTGDLWKIGNHRLLCGDSTNLDDVEKLMMGETARMTITDPPWNVAIGKDSNPRHRQREGLENDDMTDEEYSSFCVEFIKSINKICNGDVYCKVASEYLDIIGGIFRDQKFHWSATIIWVKDVFVLGRSKYHRRYEPLWYGWSEKSKSSFCDLRNLDDVWEIPRPKRSEEHPTMMPVELPTMAIQNSSEPGDVVVDIFCGSGTTLVACENLGRHGRGIEKKPAFCAVILERMATAFPELEIVKL